MATTHQVQRRESRDEALVRLAAGARERGIHVLRHEPTHEYYVESRSELGKLHRVTAHSCSCRGFQYRGYCCHLAALLDALGWLPTSPTPTPPVRMPEERCHNCQGNGWGYGTVAGGHMDRVSCWTCDGTGVEPATAIAA